MKSYFRLEREDITLKNIKGFTLIESLVAMSIVMMLVVTIVPIDILIKQERKTLQDKRAIVLTLHDYLQQMTWENDMLYDEQQIINGVTVYFDYSLENQLIKGCASWDNVKQRKEKYCLYGYKQ